MAEESNYKSGALNTGSKWSRQPNSNWHRTPRLPLLSQMASWWRTY